jgi:predicted DNA-binding transcriptional regulator YafY
LARALRVAVELATTRRGVALKTLADRYGWPLRTVYRDVEALEGAGFPVIREEGRFRLPPGWLAVQQLGVGSQERAALFLARQLAAGLRETDAGRALERLWQGLSGDSAARPALLPDGAERAIGLRSPLAIDYSAHRRTISTIECALRESRALDVRYEALSTGELTSRLIEPGALHWDAALESLYLIAWCRLRQGVRVFAVHRFRMVSLLGERVAVRPECSSRAALRHALRIFRGGAVQKVAVRLTGWAAREAAERQIHPSQRMTRLPSGGVRIELQVAGLEEVTRWILGFGALAVVEGPPSLAEHIREELLRASRAYPKRRLSPPDKRRAETA